MIDQDLRIPKNQKFMNRGVQMAVRAAQDAMSASSMDFSNADPDRVGLHVGSGQPGLEPSEFFAALDLMVETGQPIDFKGLGGRPSRLIDRYFPLRSLANAGSGLLSAEICVRGPGINFVQGDTASAVALETACYDLLEGRCDVALAGGFDSLLTISDYLAYEKQGLLSASPPERAYRPFDRERDGIVLGEGAAILVLERLADARGRGAPILGEIMGFGNSMETADCLQSVGSQETALAACTQATQDAAADFVVAHGIGTQEADRREAGVLGKIFGRAVPITALKSQTGYVGAATAAVELVLAMLALQHGQIPPIARHCLPDEDCDLDFVAGCPRTIPPNACALCMNWSWVGQCTAIMARALR
jgi:3-oxoacyl-(acyl-carrier-protein) synthase